MRHKNITVFIPHLGCPNDCVFCNQRKITQHRSFDESGVKAAIDEAVATLEPGDDAEIAFFGGSFTGIDRDLMIRLLELGHSYVASGAVSSLREFAGRVSDDPALLLRPPTPEPLAETAR